MESKLLKECGSKWKLILPPDLTPEEIMLKSKYEELKKAKERLLHFQTAENCKSPEIFLKSNAKKPRSVSQSEINSKKSSDFKKSSKQQRQSDVRRSLPAYTLEDDTEPRSINVKGKNLTDEYLCSHFNKFGCIRKIRTNENKSTAVLTFARPNSAKIAVEELDGRTVDGIHLVASIQRRRNSSWCNLDKYSSTMLSGHEGRSVHLSFKGYITQKNVEEFFQSVGRVTKIYLNVIKKFGFITFEKEEQAQRAIKELNGHSCKGVRMIISPQKFMFNDAIKACDSSGAGGREMVSYDDIDIANKDDI